MLKRALLIGSLGACALGILSASVRGDQPSPGDNASGGDPRIVTGLGRPSSENRVNFETNFEGSPVLKDVLVKEGDRVKAGDALMVEDMAMANAQLAISKAAASATGQVAEAQAQIDVKSKELARLVALGPSASETERLNTQLDRDVAIARKQQANEDHDQKTLEAQRDQLRIDHMTLRSPIDGIVEKISLFAGEGVDNANRQDGACLVVCNDPLWVEVNTVKAIQVARLKLGDIVQVAYPDAPDKWLDAKVVYLDPVVEGGTQRRTFRVALANPDDHPAGLEMSVKLPDKVFSDVSLAGAK
jgi:hypothetical protein